MITNIIIPILLGSIVFIFKDNCEIGTLQDFIDNRALYKVQTKCVKNPKDMLGAVIIQNKVLKIVSMSGTEYVLNNDAYDISSNLWKGWSLTLNKGFSWIFKLSAPPESVNSDSYSTTDIKGSKDCVTDGTHIFPRNKKIFVSGVFIPNLYVEIQTIERKRKKRSLMICPVVTVNIADIVGIGAAACDTSSIDSSIEKKIKDNFEKEESKLKTEFGKVNLGIQDLRKLNDGLEERVVSLAKQNLFSEEKQKKLGESFSILSKSIVNEFKNLKNSFNSQFTDVEISLLNLDIDVISLRIGLIKNQLMESLLNKYMSCDLYQDDFENMVSASKYYASYGGLIESRRIENSLRNISFILTGIISSQRKIYEFLNETISIQSGEIRMTGNLSDTTKHALSALNSIIKDDSLSIIKGMSASSRRWIVVIGYAIGTALNLLMMTLSKWLSQRTGPTETARRNHHNIIFKVSALASVISFELLIFQIIFVLIG